MSETIAANAHAKEVYNVARWSAGYFDINTQGDCVARLPLNKEIKEVSFQSIIDAVNQQGLSLPVLLRFSNILHDRVENLYRAFEFAQKRHAYEGGYTAVYPIKVNQQRRVVEELLNTPNRVIGLEAGSKPELMAVLSLNNTRQHTLICNGYKDREYIRMALIAKALGHRIFIIIEKLSEVAFIVEESRKLGITPLLGLRIRLTTLGKGKWQNSGGLKSKFGFNAGLCLQVIKILEQNGLLKHLEMLHCHLGSQVANIADIENGMAEYASTYAQICQLGAPLKIADVGGGLGVDYEGTRSRSACSINYTFEKYANAIVEPMAATCQRHNLPHPEIITESGRAMVAHHAVLLTQVIDVESPVSDADGLNLDSPNPPHMIGSLIELVKNVDNDSPTECFNEGQSILDEVNRQYAKGQLSLQDKAWAESLFQAISQAVQKKLSMHQRRHRELLDKLNEQGAHKLFCNFSLFQSIPDAWAIQQVFPIMPMANMTDSIDCRAVVQDMTCDSDGRIDNYVDGDGVELSLPLPKASIQKHSVLGIFLVGAYQEILGDLHNLFGDTDSIHVEANETTGFTLSEPLLGDRVDSVLKAVNFEAQKLIRSYKLQLDNSILDNEQRRNYLDILNAGLTGYTYLEPEEV